MGRAKIALIGAGNIGGTLAHMIAQNGIADVVLVDIAKGIPQGKALDLAQAGSITGDYVSVNGSNEYNSIRNSNAVVITAGIARKPGMSRDDLLATNAAVMKTVAEQVRVYAPNAFVIIITNPLDIMVKVFQESSGLPANMVVGMAGVLDSARFSCFLAEALSVAKEDIKTLVLGGHGDLMVPLPRYTSIGGVPLLEFVKNGTLPSEMLNKIIERTRNGGAEIVQLLQTGSAFVAPATAAYTMLLSHLYDQKRILPCAALLNGEYGYKNIYAGVPVIIGQNGVERIIELELTPEEKRSFAESITALQNVLTESTNVLKGAVA